MHRLARATTTVFTPLRYAKTYVVARALATLATNIAHWLKMNCYSTTIIILAPSLPSHDCVLVAVTLHARLPALGRQPALGRLSNQAVSDPIK